MENRQKKENSVKKENSEKKENREKRGWNNETEYLVSLQDILRFDRPVYAHIDIKGEKEKEPLEEHTALCEKYFSRLLDKKKIRSSFQSLERGLLEGLPEEAAGLFWKALYGVITFHDTGKINPLFQSIRMKNSAFREIQIRTVDSSHHSLLSAAIYLDFFLAEAEALTTETKMEKSQCVRLYKLLLLNAFLISRHHSSLEKYAQFLEQLEEGNAVHAIWTGMDRGEYRKLYRGRFSHVSSHAIAGRVRRTPCGLTERQKFAQYIYARLLFSLLTACDYYATSEYANGTETTYFGSAEEIREMAEYYEKTDRVRGIRSFDPQTVPDNGTDINYLRNCLFQEAEQKLLQSKDKTLFFLEAPTGSGKSNIALNCGFQLLKKDMDKIIYVYPFNNLVEQNRASLEEIFGNTGEFQKIAVLNSVTPIPCEKNREKEGEEYPSYYSKALLDRQFLNYPFILTTHVSLFQTMFGTEREAVFGFHQLAGCVLVLDEIQSYKNTIWTEIIRFLQYFGDFLGCRVLIMSATLPDFELLTGQREDIVRLISHRERYFGDARFRDRVRVSFELMQPDFSEDMLYYHIKKMLTSGKKIMVEFIRKNMAYDFYERFCQDVEINVPMERMTGDDNTLDRQAVLKKVKDEEYCKNGFLLIATQVVEAGIDIDMDIGYKDISMLDSEEQFLGRINRNKKREGIAFFFNLCRASSVYGQDYRLNKAFTLENSGMREVLEEKNFSLYYQPVLELLKKEWNDSMGKEGYDNFLREELEKLDFKAVEKRMELIEENSFDMSVYLARVITDDKGNTLDGRKIWEQYKALLSSPPADYARFRVEMSEVRSRLNNFIYQIKKNSNLAYNDRIGELYCIENGEDYFADGRLDRNRLIQEGGMFLDI